MLGTKVHALDDSAIVLALPHPSALAEGTLLEIAWSSGPKWYSLSSSVGPAGKDGKLRLLPARAANEQKNRRSEPRYRLALGVRVKVEKGRTLRPGSELRSEDRGRQPRRHLVHGRRRPRDRRHAAPDDARRRRADRQRHARPRRARDPPARARRRPASASPSITRRARSRRAAPHHLVRRGSDQPRLPIRGPLPILPRCRRRCLLPLLASRSPQRRAILTQLGLPYRVVEPDYDELPLPVSRERARRDARARQGALGRARARRRGDPRRRHGGRDRRRRARQAGRRRPRARDAVAPRRARPRRLLRPDAAPRRSRDHAPRRRRSCASVPARRTRSTPTSRLGEWEGRAGGYAIQGRGAALVEAVDRGLRQRRGPAGGAARPVAPREFPC